jgi:glucans biosynthesis protein
LTDPSQLLINAFGGGSPVGFGLMQRDTDFDHYQDLEARYEKRPSVWVTPRGDWDKGHLELVQLPTENEYNDNIVAYWVPEETLTRGQSVSYTYTMSWHSATRPRSSQGLVSATRIVKKNNGAMFIVDFSGEALKALPVDKALASDIWASRGARITSSQLIKNTVAGGWRLVLHVQWDNAGFMEGVLPGQRPAIEFRAFLKDAGTPVTETWSYTYHP